MEESCFILYEPSKNRILTIGVRDVRNALYVTKLYTDMEEFTFQTVIIREIGRDLFLSIEGIDTSKFIILDYLKY